MGVQLPVTMEAILKRTVQRVHESEDEKLLIEMEKRYFGKLSFRADPALHAEAFRIHNVATNEELAAVNPH